MQLICYRIPVALITTLATPVFPSSAYTTIFRAAQTSGAGVGVETPTCSIETSGPMLT
jgi:hypothetical protein